MQADSTSIKEEILNSLTHGTGLLLSVIGFPLLFILSRSDLSFSKITSFTIYGLVLVFFYLMSTLYHSLTFTKAGSFLKTLDHSAIFLLIAGTYTPFLILSIKGSFGWGLLAAVWGIAAIGILLESVAKEKMKKISVLLYLLMGWIGIIAIKPAVVSLPQISLILLVTGGLLYSFGIFFYKWQKLPFNHGVWHLFVMSGSFCHFFAVTAL